MERIAQIQVWMVKHSSTSMYILPEAECNDHIEESGIYHNYPLSERRLYCIYSIMKCTVTSGIGLTGGDNWIYGTQARIQAGALPAPPPLKKI